MTENDRVARLILDLAALLILMEKRGASSEMIFGMFQEFVRKHNLG